MLLGITLGLGLVSCAGLVYSGYRMFRLPRARPSQIRTTANHDQPLLLCLGDSITHGHVGADWVGRLRGPLGERGVLVANGGINGQQAWNLGQRLEADLRCRPTAVVLMIGSNDVMAAERPSRAKSYEKTNRLPRTPDLEWSASELEALVERVRAEVPHVALCTIPPLGADPRDPAEALVARWNDTVRAVAGTSDITLIDVHATVQRLNEAASRPYEGSPGAIMRLMGLGGMAHYLLGRSWDSIATARGWGATFDGIHLGETAAGQVSARIQAWVEQTIPISSIS